MSKVFGMPSSAIVVALLVLGGAMAYASFYPESAQYAAVSASQKDTLSQKSLDASAKKLIDEIKYGLKQKGVHPAFRDGLLKRLDTLRKQGLSEKKVKEIKSLIASLPVGGEKNKPTSGSTSTASACKDKELSFTAAFTDLSKIDALNPIGSIGGGSPARSYIGVKAGMEAPIYAPAAATLRTIVYADRGAGYGEYGLIFRVGCNIEFMFDHIDRISERLMQHAPKTAATTSQVPGAEVNIEVRAGELLGYTNGTDLARTFDFLVMNYGKKSSYINPKRWEWDQALYGTCPYDYFTPELRAQYYEILGKPSGTGLVRAASCGNPSHDVAGTASGGWFKGSSTDKRGEYLTIAREYDDVMVAYRKDGDAFATREDVQKGKPYLRIVDTSPKKYPADVRVGESVCYSGNNQWAFITLVSATELAVATGSGSCPGEFPDQAKNVWVR